MVADYPDLLDLAREAHLDKFFIGFRVDQSQQPQGAWAARPEAKSSSPRRVIKTVHKHGIGVVGFVRVRIRQRHLETFDAAYDFIRTAELDGVSATVLNTLFRAPRSARACWRPGASSRM